MNDKKAYLLIGSSSALVLAFLFWLLEMHQPGSAPAAWVRRLPALNACFNFSSACCLASGLWMIKNGRRSAHIRCMLAALFFTVIFLVSYSFYHHNAGDTRFGGQGWIRPVYFAILISHVALSAVITPLAMAVVFFAATARFERHKKIARITFPLWLYVSLSGVAVYLLLRPYYATA